MFKNLIALQSLNCYVVEHSSLAKLTFFTIGSLIIKLLVAKTKLYIMAKLEGILVVYTTDPKDWRLGCNIFIVYFILS